MSQDAARQAEKGELIKNKLAKSPVLRNLTHSMLRTKINIIKIFNTFPVRNDQVQGLLAQGQHKAQIDSGDPITT